jgi:two-component system sensor histidine kinase and response regulator WspE
VSNDTSQENNDPMLDLFFSDFIQQTASIRKLLEANEIGKLTPEIFQHAQRSLHALRGAARIVRLDPLTGLSDRVLALFEMLQNVPPPLAVKAVSILRDVAVLFESLIAFGSLGIGPKLKEFDQNFKEILAGVEEFLTTAPKPTEIKQETQAAHQKPAVSVQSPAAQTLKEPPPPEPIDIDLTMIELFRTELRSQLTVLNNSLIDYEQTERKSESLEVLMRSSHSIKGAARVIGLIPIEKIAHVMEDCFVAAQEQKLFIDSNGIDIFLSAVDFFARIIEVPNLELLAFLKNEQSKVTELIANLASYKNGEYIPREANTPPLSQSQPQQPVPTPQPQPQQRSTAEKVAALQPSPPPSSSKSLSKQESTKSKIESIKERTSARPPEPPRNIPKGTTKEGQDRIIRVTAQNLNRLMGLAGESLVESRWLQPFSDALMKVKKSLNDLSKTLDLMRDFLEERQAVPGVEDYLSDLQHRSTECRQNITDRLAELEMFIIRHSSLSDRLYREVIDSRMRPFADGVEGFPRLVRDLAKHLNKKVRLEILGRSTPVDREILEKLDAPLNHLIRNSIDHGIELPEERIRVGKNPEGIITLEAQHRAGMLAITVSDDGRGINLDDLRETLIHKNLVKTSLVKSLTESELLDFLFLPGFSTASQVTEISGRGVGLNVVHSMIQDVSGNVRVATQPGKGMSFFLQLPLTLSVIRALIVEIAEEPYAFPLARIDRALLIPKDQVDIVENRQYFNLEGQNIGLVSAQQVLGVDANKVFSDILPVVVLSDRHNCYGIVVDAFLGERELVVQELDPRLGKTQDISSGALMEDGSPVLVVDIEDMVRSIDTILTGGRLHRLSYGEASVARPKKRILVVDDSITVREVESRLLQNHGYDVQSAINGMDGWNALRMGAFDLVVTDVDMPRMNGIELVKNIRADAKTKNLPVMIISYKEREEDRLKGMEAGANYYLTKSGFHDETLLRAVEDLIGKP